MIGVLDDGRIGANDLLITLIDLAARGYLTISAPTNPDGHWRLTRTTKTADALRTFETALIETPFVAGDTRTLDSLLADDTVVDSAIAALQHDADTTGWFVPTAESHWGKIGGSLVLLGLVALATGIIIGMNTLPIPGITGGVLLTGSGLLIVTLAKMQHDRSEIGHAARQQLARYHDWLSALAAHQLLPDAASMLFNGNLAAALAFGMNVQFADVLDQAYARASGWGTTATLKIDHTWMPGADTPAAAVREAARFVAAGLVLAKRYAVS
jgi:uncharacterized protein (TIGR04222 family)